MELSEEFSNLFHFLESEGIVISSSQKEELHLYHRSLISYSKQHNIVSKGDIEFIIQKHFLGSFYFVKHIAQTADSPGNILDIGSGAGFPGIILSIFFRNSKVVLVDSVRKKTLFLKRVQKELNLNLTVHNERIESFLYTDKTKFNIITARALASISDLIHKTASRLNESKLYTIKGINYKSEITNACKFYKISEFSIDPNWIKYSDFLKNKIHLAISK